MEEVESFEHTVEKLVYIVTIFRKEINKTTAYFGIITAKDSKTRTVYSDHNDMVYYFTNKEVLKERIINHFKFN